MLDNTTAFSPDQHHLLDEATEVKGCLTSPFMTSNREMQWVHSYNPGAHMGATFLHYEYIAYNRGHNMVKLLQLLQQHLTGCCQVQYLLL